MKIEDELEAAATANEGRPLVIMGQEIDKTDARQVYGALCWIEASLLGMLGVKRG